jgi:hypothetical protein
LKVKELNRRLEKSVFRIVFPLKKIVSETVGSSTPSMRLLHLPMPHTTNRIIQGILKGEVSLYR